MDWNHQLVRIYQKGMAAQQAGVPASENPYLGGERGGTGGNLQNQRRRYWQEGWQKSHDLQVGDDN